MSEAGNTPLGQCPHCTALIGAEAKFCSNCGHKVGGPVSPSLILDPEIFDEEDDPFSDTEAAAGQLVPTRRTARRRAVKSAEPQSRWSVPVVGAAGFLALVVAVLAFGWLHAEAPQPAQVARATPPAAAKSTAPIVEPPPKQQWLGRRQAAWAADGSKTITFDLQANEEVPVWMTRARPQLTVRCVSRATEVFVSLGSAASVEGQAGIHTVRIQIDDDPVVEQQWSDSTSSHELFAPDGRAITRRLSEAHHMKFGFTPYNAPAVVADFSVEGFDELAPLVAKTCGWQLDDDRFRYQPPRSARLQ